MALTRRWYLFVAILSYIAVAWPALPVHANNEPTSTFEFGAVVIGFFPYHVTHDQAEIRCGDWGTGSRLVVIDNSKLQSQIEMHIRQEKIFHPSDWTSGDPFDPGFHVGAHDKNTEGRWVWSDSNPVPLDKSEGFNNWGPAEPNNYMLEAHSAGEDCMSVLMTDAFPDYGFSVGTWIDNDCTSEKFYICQKEIGSVYTGRKRQAQTDHQHMKSACNNGGISGIVNLPLRKYELCDGVGFKYITRWKPTTNNYKWVVKSNWDHVEIEVFPKRALASYVEGGKVYVDRIFIKWKSGSAYGSQHSVGKRRGEAEIQILHEDHPRLGKVAFSFFIKERHNPPNRKWDRLLQAVITARKKGGKVEIAEPMEMHNLLSDTHKYHRHHHRTTFMKPIKYEIAATNSCGRVTWLVFPRLAHISTSQLTILRSFSSQEYSGPRTKMSVENICMM